MYCIATQCNIFENAEKLPEETARQEWSGMTEFSLKTIEKAGGWRGENSSWFYDPLVPLCNENAALLSQRLTICT